MRVRRRDGRVLRQACLDTALLRQMPPQNPQVVQDPPADQQVSLQGMQFVVGQRITCTPKCQS